MIHFLHSHPSLIEDLETAVQIISRHCPDNDISYCTTAHHLQMLADELNYMDNAVGWTDPLHSDNAFRLNVGDAKSSWKRWQDNCYTIAKQYDGYIFTYGGISALVKRLNEHASKFKNAEPIKEPDWKFCWEYDIRPSVCIGENCVLVFEAIRGYYNIHEDINGHIEEK